MNQPDHTQTDEATPREVGAEMAKLRAQFGLSPHEVSERLHIRPRYIAAMEEGRYELMPAKAYARGYMHSYAEFLGMDADAVVAKCFAQVAAAVPAPARDMPTRRMVVSPRASLQKSPWRGRAAIAVGALMALVIFTQLAGLLAGDSLREARVTPVSDTMLSSVRTIVMPIASNYACLTDNQLFSCFHADAMTQAIGQLNLLALGQFTLDVDVSDLMMDAPQVAVDKIDQPEEIDATRPDA